MKKVLFVFALMLAFTVTKAQSNLTILISEKVEKGYFKQESYKWNVLGLQNAAEASKFVENLKKDTNIKSAEITPSTTPGQYVLNISVNKIYGWKYFDKVMKRNGVEQAKINGEIKKLGEEKAAGK